MIFDIFPHEIKNALLHINYNAIEQIRLRVDKPICVQAGQTYFLGDNGLCDDVKRAMYINFNQLRDIVFKACECSVYAYNQQIKQGFIGLKGGARVGLCGEVVTENGIIKTIKNFSSVNVRLPHQIKNCSLKVLPFLYNADGVINTLIISPPGMGKTTLLRDLCFNFSQKCIAKNILVVDERGELAGVNNGSYSFDLGPNTDIQTNCTKQFGIENGMRTMSPDVIFIDEIANESDVNSVMYAIGSGVKVVATTHAKNVKDLYKRVFMEDLLKNKFFERIVVLSNRNGVGTIENIFDCEQNLVY